MNVVTISTSEIPINEGVTGQSKYSLISLNRETHWVS